tara:strand:- start:221 stop:781 length:561 start_codon:yes stop_codon:yes gene_type:complete
MEFKFGTNFAIGMVDLPIDLPLLAKTCLEKEKELLKLPCDSHSEIASIERIRSIGLNEKQVSTRSMQYNLFDWDTPETRKLYTCSLESLKEYNNKLGDSTPEVYIQAWLNVLRLGESIKKHHHYDDGYLTANFTVQCDKTYTCYDPIKEENVDGRFTIFPSYVPHYTTEHTSEKERITIAMDFIVR